MTHHLWLAIASAVAGALIAFAASGSPSTKLPERLLQQQEISETVSERPQRPPATLPKARPKNDLPEGLGEENEPSVRDDEKASPLWTDVLIAIFAGLALVIALAQAVFFVWQLVLMRRGVKDATVAANASRDSADAAKESVHIALRTLQNDRAWMTWSATDVVKTPAGGLLVYCVWENTGRTPALDVRCNITVVGREASLPVPDPDLEIAEDRKGPVGPGKTTKTAIMPIQPEQWARIQAGETNLYVFSQASYRDLFSEEQRDSVIATRMVFQGEKVHDQTGERVMMIQHLFVGNQTRNT